MVTGTTVLHGPDRLPSLTPRPVYPRGSGLASTPAVLLVDRATPRPQEDCWLRTAPARLFAAAPVPHRPERRPARREHRMTPVRRLVPRGRFKLPEPCVARFAVDGHWVVAALAPRHVLGVGYVLVVELSRLDDASARVAVRAARRMMLRPQPTASAGFAAYVPPAHRMGRPDGGGSFTVRRFLRCMNRRDERQRAE
jgi:hypothetical protein